MWAAKLPGEGPKMYDIAEAWATAGMGCGANRYHGELMGQDES